MKIAKLARYYYLLGDIGNYSYYVFRLNHQKEKINGEKFIRLKKIIGNKNYQNSVNYLKDNEYGNIIFPLAMASDLKKTIPVDDQSKLDSFEYWQKQNYQLLLKKYSEDEIDSITESHDKTNNISYGLIKNNTYEYIKHRENFLPWPELRTDSFYHKILKPWNYRNKKAIERLDSALKIENSQRAIISFGSRHLPFFVEILKKDYPKYEVVILEDL